jgi:hypothetical protein
MQLLIRPHYAQHCDFLCFQIANVRDIDIPDASQQLNNPLEPSKAKTTPFREKFFDPVGGYP